MTETPTIPIAQLDRAAWLRAWSALPAERRSTYYHPDYVAAAARWEGGDAECLRIDGDDGSMLYPYVRHAIPGDGGGGAFDVQTAYGYGGPLFAGDWNEDGRVEALRDVARYLAERGAVAEFVRCHERWADIDALRAAGYATPVVRTNVTCDLADPVPESWASSVRRNLKRAALAGLRWRAGTDAADLDAFVALYAITAERLGMAASYRFDVDSFGALFAMGGPLTRLVLVETPDAKAVAGAIVLCSGELAHYHLGGSDFAHQNDRPNDLLYLAMAETARAAGCRWISWGGGLSTDPADSLFRFKSGFGRIQTPVHIGCRVLNEPAYLALVDQWDRRNPHGAATCKMFLRYRG